MIKKLEKIVNKLKSSNTNESSIILKQLRKYECLMILTYKSVHSCWIS